MQEILDENDIVYYKNITIKGVKSDYDFIIVLNKKLYALEVKNHKFLNRKSLKTITGKLSYKCKKLYEYIYDFNPQTKYKYVEGLVISINGKFKKGEYLKEIFSLDDFRQYLQKYNY
ncbi:hypothetical protein GF362_00040 [Candidatus Dojkabacteria bacterium]|nr:hypothetical protein [Candidatus Dojkabacteria bacterium]